MDVFTSIAVKVLRKNRLVVKKLKPSAGHSYLPNISDSPPTGP